MLEGVGSSLDWVLSGGGDSSMTGDRDKSCPGAERKQQD